MDDAISRAAALDVLVTSPNFHTTLTRIEELPAVYAIPVEWLKSKRKEALQEGMRPDEVDAVEMVLWMWQKEQEAR